MDTPAATDTPRRTANVELCRTRVDLRRQESEENVPGDRAKGGRLYNCCSPLDKLALDAFTINGSQAVHRLQLTSGTAIGLQN